jgi:hypothetical protein
MAEGADSHRRVDPSTSVNKNVTVPEGAPTPTVSHAATRRAPETRYPEVPVTRCRDRDHSFLDLTERPDRLIASTENQPPPSDDCWPSDSRHPRQVECLRHDQGPLSGGHRGGMAPLGLQSAGSLQDVEKCRQTMAHDHH